MMRLKSMRFRWLRNRIPSSSSRRLVVLAGARQIGKTTLAREHYADLRYVNLDAIENREFVRDLSAASWGAEVGPAVLDEVQKSPEAFDKVKYAYDEGTLDFSVLLGSSRLLLLDRIRESLAGRAFVYDMWPLMLSELAYDATDKPPLPLLHHIIEDSSEGFHARLLELQEVLLPQIEAPLLKSFDHLETWGGMPELLFLSNDERRQWLRSYQTTFLERDLADLATLSDLLPFRKLQRLVMLRTGQLLSFSDLARDAGIAASTARRYLEYLRLSYQAVLLPPYGQNLTSSAIKSPKVYWIDLGQLRHSTRQQGPLTGALFETLVVSEIIKWLSTMGCDAEAFFYRTRSGLELDLLIETAGGLVGCEIKARGHVVAKDLTALRKVAQAAVSKGLAWKGGIVVYMGKRLQSLDPVHNLWAVPVHRLLAG